LYIDNKSWHYCRVYAFVHEALSFLASADRDDLGKALQVRCRAKMAPLENFHRNFTCRIQNLALTGSFDSFPLPLPSEEVTP
jgi:hypothetical protein